MNLLPSLGELVSAVAGVAAGVAVGMAIVERRWRKSVERDMGFLFQTPPAGSRVAHAVPVHGHGLRREVAAAVAAAAHGRGWSDGWPRPVPDDVTSTPAGSPPLPLVMMGPMEGGVASEVHHPFQFHGWGPSVTCTHCGTLNRTAACGPGCTATPARCADPPYGCGRSLLDLTPTEEAGIAPGAPPAATPERKSSGE